MSGSRRRRAPPAEPEYRPGQLLDWRDSTHWSSNAKPCRYCDRPTHLRDSKRSPAHKVCAEAALAQQAADTAAAYHQEGTR
ncbi:hypothetical protein [Streptomyces parvulus]|uniref:hypothetical protein n=1 Tax=Streptomyces parvulus TaxID=146923 RepID=UPI0037182E2E